MKGDNDMSFKLGDFIVDRIQMATAETTDGSELLYVLNDNRLPVAWIGIADLLNAGHQPSRIDIKRFSQQKHLVLFRKTSSVDIVADQVFTNTACSRQFGSAYSFFLHCLF